MPTSAQNPDLEVMFIDFDCYFAGVEMMDNPELRGRPVVITPTPGPSGCCITSSYEARAFGIKTGCRVSDARKLCPDVVNVRARPARYIEVHHQLIEAIESAVHITSVDSVDECWGQLMANERERSAAERIARSVKAAIRERVGSVTCSIGVAPNRLIAKVVGGFNKPDGLTIVGRSELPGALLDLDLTDLPGINTGINRRLRAKGIATVADLYERTPAQLREAWGSIDGVRWWHWIRGDHLTGPKTRRRTVGHQHVLAPEYRAHDRAWGVAVRLLSKAAQRMRSMDYVAGKLALSVRYTDGRGFGDWSPLGGTGDTVVMYNVLRSMWDEAPVSDVLSIGVTLLDLELKAAQMPLFDRERAMQDLWGVIDRINAKCGVDTVYMAPMHGERGSAPRRIPFGKPPDLRLADLDE